MKLFKIRSDRDFIDILIALGVIVSLLAAFGVLNVKPKIEISGKLVYLDFKDFPYADKIVNSSKPLNMKHQKYMPGSYELMRKLSWQYHAWLIEITIKNKRNTPISLEDFEVKNLKYEPFYDSITLFPRPIFIYNDEFEEYETPYYVIGGNEIKKINIVVCVYMDVVGIRTSDTLHKESIAMLKHYFNEYIVEDSEYIESLLDNFPDMFVFNEDSSSMKMEFDYQRQWFGTGKIFNNIDSILYHPEARPFIYRLAFEKCYYQTKLNSLQFSVKDNFGRIHLSKVIDLKTSSGSYMLSEQDQSVSDEKTGD